MSFAKWKNMSKLLQNFHWMHKKEAERACQAAYKAGERDGLKQAESEKETPKCKCGKPAKFYNPLAGHSVSCESCNAKNAKRQRDARAKKQ